MTTVKAQLMNTRLAPRKVRLIVNLVRGKNALLAMDQLAFVVRRPADPVAKLIKSAIANATNNFNMVASNLYIKEFYVDEGVKLKRFRAAGFGRAREVQKKTSHIHLVLAEKVPGLKGEAPKKVDKKHEHIHEHTPGHAPKTTKPEIKTELGDKTKTKGGFIKKMFQRKSI
ncbi:MAG: 50S ribosomal protein L22 [Candidatus Yanofskybacteria bacterium RIFCSPLOWO2_02_FULL_47_9b]|uniref:Large ribosomal subunit protein uL22 n=1 Tax=Candidatus Yanofskybacteria bacterium RIFCSPLOWO2_02_FULL_47_9b TaxID=1802708 RepID=A0A1F8H812_9BACT|nr:MAG: 50S ribosomal protein L22 [Candidatus Yanofskybacteria bacterium RIFCSPLOWO2_02_FULL_47_9b]